MNEKDLKSILKDLLDIKKLVQECQTILTSTDPLKTEATRSRCQRIERIVDLTLIKHCKSDRPNKLTKIL